MDAAGSVALITGGASGLGEGAARTLVARGARVGILDLSSSSGAQIAKELGDAAMFLPADVREPEAVANAVSSLRERFGRLDICVNSAGIGGPARVLDQSRTMFPLDAYRTVVDVNLVGLFDVLRNAAHAMSFNEPDKDGQRGVIVNVASIAGYEGQSGQAAYSASKGGVIAMTLPLARDLASWGIRVVTICPGIFDTAQLADASDKVRSRLEGIQVFPRRLGQPDEFAKLVLSIVDNVMLNGEVIRLDAAARLGAS